MVEVNLTYDVLPTMELFHQDQADMRCIVGPVGSGKTSAATMEIGTILPRYLSEKYGIKETRWVVLRNTLVELFDTTQQTFRHWMPQAKMKNKVSAGYREATVYDQGLRADFLFRSCDNPDDIAKFKSLEITGYWGDESIEIPQEVKRMLKNRIGRYPARCPRRFGIETTNPPDVEHPTYSEFLWMTSIPGPAPEKQPLENHHGFWQPPRENEANLRHGYYDDLIKDYRDNPDWIATYVQGHPGIIVKGRLVYRNFKKDLHVAPETLLLSGDTLIRGWDNSGNCPACIVVQEAPDGSIQVLREFNSDVENIVDFTKRVIVTLDLQFPGVKYLDYADPAGANKYSRREGGFTSNAELMAEVGVSVISSEQNFAARTGAVENVLQRQGRLLIDPSCVRLINGFIGGYCYGEIGTTGTYRDAPDKNRFSHIHDALQYVLVKLVIMSHKRSHDIDWDKIGV